MAIDPPADPAEDPPGRRSRQEAGEQTRQALLAAGATLIREQPIGRFLNHITAPEVARRAGRTIGAFYHHWPDQDSYRRDLLAWVLAPEVLPTEQTVAGIGESLLVDLPTDELIRRAARLNLVEALDRPELALTVALSAVARTDEVARDLLRGQYAALNERLLPMYEAIFAANGWVPRPPFTTYSISTVVSALVEGLYVRAVAEPDAVPLGLPAEDGSPVAPDADGAWDLFSATVLALFPMVTMPAGARPAEAVSGVGGPAGEAAVTGAGTGTSTDPLASAADVRDVVRAVWALWAVRDAGASQG